MTAQDGLPGVVAERAFAYGTNSLVVSVANDMGAIGLYVDGTVQLLCPLDEATISMSPASGPVLGSTLVEIRSSVQLYVEHWIQCRVSSHESKMSTATVIDASTIRCLTPVHSQPRGWAEIEVVTTHQGAAAVGVHYQGQHLAGKFYYYPTPTVSAVAPPIGPTHGGTFVAIRGQFDRIGTLRCRFGVHSLALTVPRMVDASLIECTSPPQAVAGSAQVQVTGNGQQFSESSNSFRYYEPLGLMSLMPTKVKTEGGTILSLRMNRGVPVESNGYRFCYFGALAAPASLPADNTVACMSPALPPGYAVVEVTVNGQDFTSTGLQVQYVQVALFGLRPVSGPLIGGTDVVVSGANLLDGLGCLFDGRPAVESIALGRNKLSCKTPSFSSPGWKAVYLIEGNRTTRSTGMFHVDERVVVSAIAPVYGPVQGGTKVELLGDGFRDTYTLRCRFKSAQNHSEMAMARFVDRNQIVCTAPAHRAGDMELEVSVNGQQFDGGRKRFEYQPTASVSSVSPTTMSTEGGTPLTVHGDGFSSASEALGLLTCRIGGAVRRAVWASATAVVCNATRAPAGEARIEVSNNAREYTSSGMRVRLVSVRVLEVAPWSGPVGGATVVSVRAHGLWPGGLSCRIGDGAPSSAWGGGASRLRCLTPPSSDGVSGWVGVQLSSFHGALSSGGSFYYHSVMTASGVSPSIGPERGGTRVAVLGGGFRDAYTLRCGFGSSAAPVLARYMDESQLECSSPVHAPGSVEVLLSMNGQQYASSGVQYTYQPAASISFISPTLALAEGGTPLTVHGDGFSSTSESLGLLFCRLNHVLVRAALQSNSSVVCETPRFPPGFASVEVTNNAREFVSGSEEFTSNSHVVQFVALRITDVHPFSGPAAGGTIVTLVGFGFQVGNLACRFGEVSAIPAVRLSPYRITCASPDYPVTGWVSLEVQSFFGTAESASAFYYQASLSSDSSLLSQEGGSGASSTVGTGVRLAPLLGPTRGGTISK